MARYVGTYSRREKSNGTITALARLAGIAVVAAGVYLCAEMIKAWVADEELVLDVKSAFLIDAATGEVLFEQNADLPLPPASMSKMMTELLVLDGIREGSLRWNDEVRASGYAARVPGARMGLTENAAATIRELFDAMTIHSANDAAVALAEHISGTEEAFVRLMNERGAAIGLSGDTVFGNASGLARADIAPYDGSSHERDTKMTAKDTAFLAGYLIGRYPEVLEVTSRSRVKVSTQGQALAATNWMLKGKPFAYSGNDGLKTGYTPDAGYCFTGTVKRDGRRLISVVMGAETKESRFTESIKLYDYGFKASVLDHLKIALMAGK